MKLTVGDISFSESGYASATVGVGAGTGTVHFLLFSICKMDVSVPVVEGKTLGQYKDELLAKARERIAKMYKEIVCGENDVGEQSAILTQAANSSSIQMMQASIDELKEQITRLKEEKHSKNEAIKPFEIKDGGIIINAPQMTLTHHQISKDGLEKFIAALAEQTGLNQELDDSLVVRDADGSVRVRMNAEKQTGLKVTVSDKDDALWMRNSATLEGISSRGYLKDGTQQKIIAALEHALGQARGELLCWNNTDGVPDVGATAT